MDTSAEEAVSLGQSQIIVGVSLSSDEASLTGLVAQRRRQMSGIKRKMCLLLDTN
jgi:hypothetical protein